MLDSLFVGFGRAGEGLHLPSLLHARRLCRDEDLFSKRRPLAVDVGRARAGVLADSPVELYRTLREAVDGRDPARIVAHVCTPPNDRARILREVWATGIRRTICEKPIAVSSHELTQIVNQAGHEKIECLVASPWLSSTVTARIKQTLDGGTLGKPLSVAVTQEKARFARTQADAGHPTAFEIELPHAVGLAIHLLGAVAEVEYAAASDMEVESVVYPQLGGALLRLAHESGARSTLRSAFCSPVRRRRVLVKCEAGEIEGHFPVGGDDRFGQVIVRRGGDEPVCEILRDEQFTRMLISYYAYFAGRREPVVADLAFHAVVSEILFTARALAATPSSSSKVLAAVRTGRIDGRSHVGGVRASQAERGAQQPPPHAGWQQAQSIADY